MSDTEIEEWTVPWVDIRDVRWVSDMTPIYRAAKKDIRHGVTNYYRHFGETLHVREIEDIGGFHCQPRLCCDLLGLLPFVTDKTPKRSVRYWHVQNHDSRRADLIRRIHKYDANWKVRAWDPVKMFKRVSRVCDAVRVVLWSFVDSVSLDCIASTYIEWPRRNRLMNRGHYELVERRRSFELSNWCIMHTSLQRHCGRALARLHRDIEDVKVVLGQVDRFDLHHFERGVAEDKPVCNMAGHEHLWRHRPAHSRHNEMWAKLHSLIVTKMGVTVLAQEILDKVHSAWQGLVPLLATALYNSFYMDIGLLPNFFHGTACYTELKQCPPRHCRRAVRNWAGIQERRFELYARGRAVRLPRANPCQIQESCAAGISLSGLYLWEADGGSNHFDDTEHCLTQEFY